MSYFGPTAKIGLISPNLIGYLNSVRAVGIKVALNTGYPRRIQEGILEKLPELKNAVDSFISAEDVGAGRPAPFMIHTLMQRLGITDVRHVAKAGDAVRDVEEGQAAGCRLNIGVLSGADDSTAFSSAGATLIVPDVTHIPI